MQVNWPTTTIVWCGEPKWLRTDNEAKSGSAIPDDRAKKTRVIVIDDESLIAETVVEILNGQGFEAIAASSGREAVELAASLQPDIILSDVIMPGMNGIDTATKIRELVPHCRIVLFSGQAATVDLLEKARQQGYVFEILAKPIKPEQLIAALRTRIRDQ